VAARRLPIGGRTGLAGLVVALAATAALAGDLDRWVLFVTGAPSGNMQASLTGARIQNAPSGAYAALSQPGLSRIDLSFDLPSVPRPAYLYVDQMTSGATGDGVTVEMTVNGARADLVSLALDSYESAAPEITDVLRPGGNSVSYRIMPESLPGEVRVRGFLLTRSADPSMPAQEIHTQSERTRLVGRVLQGLAIAAVVFLLPLLLGGHILEKLYRDTDRFARANTVWSLTLVTFALVYAWVYIGGIAAWFTTWLAVMVYVYGLWVLLARRPVIARGRG